MAAGTAGAVSGASAALRQFAGDNVFHHVVHLRHQLRKALTGAGHRIDSRHRGQLLLNLVHLLAVAGNHLGVGIRLAHRIAERLLPLRAVGLDYIKLGQSSSTLSGGESQRVKLAYFLSKDTPATLFIFDEPTTGLHFADIEKLMASFQALLEKGHTIIVVEHNTTVIKAADWVIDLGPDGGAAGGQLVFEGTPTELAQRPDLATGAALR